MGKYHKVSARPSSSRKYSFAVAEKAIKPLLFMHHKAISTFLGSKIVLNLVYFWVFQNYAVSDPSPVTNQ